MDYGADVLVVAAHPDDAEFGAGGTVARWAADGERIAYLVCTSGDKGSADPGVRPEELAALREREQRAAAAELGVQDTVFLRHSDQGLEDTPAFRKELARWIRTFRPHTVVTSDPYRRYIWHRDHRVVGQVTLDAVFPLARDRLAYPDLLAEGLAPHKVRYLFFWGADDVNHRVDITGTFDRKLAALRCHRSQSGAMGIEDLEAWIRERAEEMARGAGCALAEGFHRVETPP